MLENTPFLKTNPGDKTVGVVAGQHHRFMLIPIMEDETTWFHAAPLLIGVESRAFGRPEGEVLERGASVHVFDAETREEWLRFDCFDNQPHYHYILQPLQHNVVWGYDPTANGPMFQWVINTLKNNLAPMLRRAGADGLASKVEQQGYDTAVLTDVEQALVAARERTFPGTDMIAASIAWYNRWKELHPQFNTVDY
jgi:hypothetical protein